MSPDQPFIWKSSLGGPINWVGQSLWESSMGSNKLARLMESQIWHQFAGSVWGGLRKGTMASALDAGHFHSSPCAIGAFQVATQVLELRGSESEFVSLCVGSLRGTAWDSRSFFHRLNSSCFLQPELVGIYLPGTGTLGWGAWCGPGIPHS